MERVNVKEDIQQTDGNIQIAKVDNSDFHIYFNNNTAEKTLKGEKKFEKGWNPKECTAKLVSKSLAASSLII